MLNGITFNSIFKPIFDEYSLSFLYFKPPHLLKIIYISLEMQILFARKWTESDSGMSSVGFH